MSPEDRIAIAARAPAVRSRVTNGKLFSDGRTAQARRFRDLIEQFAAEQGAPFAALSARVQGLIRRAATLALEIEHQEELRASGEPFDPALYASLANAERRTWRDLRGTGKAPAPSRSLAHHLREKYGGTPHGDAA